MSTSFGLKMYWRGLKNPTIISLNAFKVSSDTKDVAPLHIFAPPSLEKSARHPAQQLFVGEVVKRKVSVRDNVPQSRLEQLGMDVTEEDESAESRIIIAGTQARGRDEFEGVFRLKLKFTVVAMVNICLSTAFLQYTRSRRPQESWSRAQCFALSHGMTQI